LLNSNVSEKVILKIDQLQTDVTLEAPKATLFKFVLKTANGTEIKEYAFLVI